MELFTFVSRIHVYVLLTYHHHSYGIRIQKTISCTAMGILHAILSVYSFHLIYALLRLFVIFNPSLLLQRILSLLNVQNFPLLSIRSIP